MLIECCFVDDKDDVALYDFRSMARAIVYGLTGQYYNEVVEGGADAEIDKEDNSPENKDALYRVQVGAYSKKTNAEAMMKKLKDAGFDAVIVKA
ncbi:MAG: SPOR domain-containing protein [Lachnospiraceae bacterium]|nr:SPOR domain-containing protein [Lachnospiraceae bacterium]